MLIAEHFFLIALDPLAGVPSWPRRTQAADQLAAAALLLDLVTQRRIQIRDSRIHVDAQVPLTHPLLSDAMHAVSGQLPTVGAALQAIARRTSPLVEKVLDGLCRRDLVHRNETRQWLVLRRVRYPLRSVQARNEAILSLRHAVHVDDDVHGLALLLLADLSGLLPELLDAREHELANRRLLALNGTTGNTTDDTLTILANVRAALLA
jgi:hypothetical protein